MSEIPQSQLGLCPNDSKFKGALTPKLEAANRSEAEAVVVVVVVV